MSHLTKSGSQSYTAIGQDAFEFTLFILGYNQLDMFLTLDARMAESVDAVDSKSTDRKVVRVRVSLWAPHHFSKIKSISEMSNDNSHVVSAPVVDGLLNEHFNTRLWSVTGLHRVLQKFRTMPPRV